MRLIDCISVGFVIGCMFGYFFIPKQTMLGRDDIAIGGIIGILLAVVFYIIIRRKHSR
jgi:ABC-type antimicrobial peptide transport system permease subunit